MSDPAKTPHSMRVLVGLRELRDAYNEWDIERFKSCMAGAGEDLAAILLCRDSVGATPLYNAVYDEREEFVQALLDAGAPADEGTAQASPLLIAAERGYMGIARRLLDHGSDVDGMTPHTKNRPLLEAILWDRTEMALMLIERGAECGDRFLSEGSGAAIDDAITKGNVPVFLKLLEKGALAARNTTPLALAAEYGVEKIVDVCLADSVLRAPMLDDSGAHEAVLSACKTNDLRLRLLSWRTQMKVEGAMAAAEQDVESGPRTARRQIGMAL